MPGALCRWRPVDAPIGGRRTLGYPHAGSRPRRQRCPRAVRGPGRTRGVGAQRRPGGEGEQCAGAVGGVVGHRSAPHRRGGRPVRPMACSLPNPIRGPAAVAGRLSTGARRGLNECRERRHHHAVAGRLSTGARRAYGQPWVYMALSPQRNRQAGQSLSAQLSGSWSRLLWYRVFHVVQLIVDTVYPGAPQQRYGGIRVEEGCNAHRSVVGTLAG